MYAYEALPNVHYIFLVGQWRLIWPGLADICRECLGELGAAWPRRFLLD